MLIRPFLEKFPTVTISDRLVPYLFSLQSTSPSESRQSVSHKDSELSAVISGNRTSETVTDTSTFHFGESPRRSSQKGDGVHSFGHNQLEGRPPAADLPHLCVAHALRLRHLVGEVRLLKACGAHALVHRGVGARRRVRRVEACLDQSFARFTCDHRLEFAGGESVDVARFAGYKQQHLGSRQGGQFICLQETEDKFSV